MSAEKLELRMLRIEDESSFRRAVEAFAREVPPWQFAFGFDDSVPFADYVRQLERRLPGHRRPSGLRPKYLFCRGRRGSGRGTLVAQAFVESFPGNRGRPHRLRRHVPSQRRRGHAVQMLRQAIPIAASPEFPRR